MSSGTQSLAALVVEQAIQDFMYAPEDSAAYRTAKKFLDGGTCSHIVCTECAGNRGWRSGECPPGRQETPCECGHEWLTHVIVEFDWSEHRDLFIGAAGIEPEALSRFK